MFFCGRDDSRRWRALLGEGGLGALGEIRTPDPRIRSPMLYPAELRARAWARLPDLAGQGQQAEQTVMSEHATPIRQTRGAPGRKPNKLQVKRGVRARRSRDGLETGMAL